MGEERATPSADSRLEPWGASNTARWLRVPAPDDHKYRRGVLGVRTGSAAFPGAAVLGVAGVWRTGIGMLHYVSPIDDPPAEFGLPSPAAAVLAEHPETVFGEPCGRPCDAWLIGSGTDPALRSDAETLTLRTLLHGDAPVVVDAGALGLVAAMRGEGSRAPAIVTPHRGEFVRLWSAVGLGEAPDLADDLETRAAATARLAARVGSTVLLKGSTTIVASPAGRAIMVGPATPWLATAGTGDVLGGVLGALVAGNAAKVQSDPSLLAEVGAAAAHLHDQAARIAVGDPACPITASDVAAALPRAVAALRA